MGSQPNGLGCELCPEGTFKSIEGGSQCRKCNDNKTTIVDGAQASGECRSMYSYYHIDPMEDEYCPFALCIFVISSLYLALINN